MATIAHSTPPLNDAATGAVVTGGGASGAQTSAPQLRTRLVLFYLALGVLALIPGLALRLGLDLDGLVGAARVGDLRQALEDIRFGSGIRFWLGVTGASMLGLLLLYPLRKVFAKKRGLGSVGGWFHVHMIFGIAAPVLIAYHTNFGLGGTNANVALWAMLAVVVSGIVGHFVYANVSAEFYTGKQQARERREAIVSVLNALTALPDERQHLINDLEAFETELLTPRRGIVASLVARLRVERQRRQISRATALHLSQCAQALQLSDVDHGRLRALLGQYLTAYFRGARHTASRSVREQVWARWRLLHLPAFLIMVVATVLHVVAVWDMDRPSDAAKDDAAADTRTVADLINATVTAPAPKPAVRPAKKQVITPTTSPADPESAPQLVGKPQVIREAVRRAQADATEATLGGKPAAPVLARPPTQVTRNADSPAPQSRAQSRRPVATLPPPAPKPAVKPAAPIDQKTATGTPDQPSEPSVAGDSKALYAELERRGQEPMMTLGGAKPRTLAEQIATLKARKAAGAFAHSLAETGFALTGKHVKVDCASCHKVPLKETRSSEPRQCIACHKKDDVHRGRRPNCAQCHTTNRFGERK